MKSSLPHFNLKKPRVIKKVITPSIPRLELKYTPKSRPFKAENKTKKHTTRFINNFEKIPHNDLFDPQSSQDTDVNLAKKIYFCVHFRCTSS